MSVKKWWKSKSITGAFGLIAMALGVLASVQVSGDDLSFLWNQVPVFVGAVGILYLRVKRYTESIDKTGWLSLILAISGGVGALPPDILEQWHLVQTQWTSIMQVALTILAGFGLHLADKPIDEKVI